MSADTWAVIHTYGLVFSIGYVSGRCLGVLMFWLNARRSGDTKGSTR